MVWRDLPEPDLRRSHAQTRYVVVDTETTGLDLRHDRVIAIGAAAVEGGLLRLSDCFETVLRQDKASPNANILIHGIGGQTQLGASNRAPACWIFSSSSGKCRSSLFVPSSTR